MVSREEVESGDTAGTCGVLRKLLDSQAAIRFFERVDLAFDGYNEDPRELFEILEVRQYVHKLDEEFPYWLYFLSKRRRGLLCIVLCIMYCFLPPYLTPDAQARILPERLGEYLTRRGFPAMNHICQVVGCSEQEIERMTDRAVRYFNDGPDRSEG